MPTSFSFREGLFNTLNEQFLHHLSRDKNERIIFSGKFGIGKSFFLDHFFKVETQNQSIKEVRYRAFHIYPVNYSIASNEDIFRYIRYDVINSMLANNIQLEETDFKEIDALPDFIRGNLMKVLATLVFMLPKVGTSLSDNYEKLKELEKHFKSHAKKSTTSQGDILIDYIAEIENKEGSIFENDVITRLISAVLQRLKKDSGHENVLIIDDLDRVDPSHVFRILNIFAAHLDSKVAAPNKLGFDKIIVVCDINNLRHIFRAMFGMHTDFNGYIDKFYSHEIFHLDNKKALLHIAEQTFKAVKTRDHTEKQYYEDHLFRKSSLPLELLQLFIANGLINLRTLLIRSGIGLDIDRNRSLVFNDHSVVSQFMSEPLIHFSLLKQIMGGYETIKEYVNRIPLSGLKFYNKNLYYNQLVYFINHETTLNKTGKVKVSIRDKNYFFTIPDLKREDFSKPALVEMNKAGLLVDEYQYPVTDFVMLINEFLDTLNIVESK